MVLKGSLREFILADIFNLLTQQKITGKLILSTGEREGIIVLRDGFIAGAVKGEEQLHFKLFNLLVQVCRYPREEIEGLFASFEKNINNLFSEIVRLNLLPQKVLESFAMSVVEDITCSFFLWNKGTYYFSSVSFVDDVAPSCVRISVESLAMEAMRRADEWNRMQKIIREDSVFVAQSRRPNEQTVEADPLTKTDEYVYAKIDGISPVMAFYRSTCLTEYKAYESLYSLINAGRITPLSTRISQSVVAALEKKEKESSRRSRPVAFAATLLIACGTIASVAFIGNILLHRLVFSDLEIDSRLARLEVPLEECIQKVAIASMQYHALKGIATVEVNDFVASSLLLPSDLAPVAEMKSIKELPKRRKNYILYPGSLLKN